MTDLHPERRAMIIEHVTAARDADLTPDIAPDMSVEEWLDSREVSPKSRRFDLGANAPKCIPCLACSHPFLSAGSHNRICMPCRANNRWAA